jgi:hypothetical protein
MLFRTTAMLVLACVCGSMGTLADPHDIIADPDPNLQVIGTVKMWGAWDDTKLFDTVYQALSDGFVVAVALTGQADELTAYLYGYSDSDNPPVTLRAVATARRLGDITYNRGGSFTLPVRKGDFWEVTLSGSGDYEAYLYWIPLGN